MFNLLSEVDREFIGEVLNINIAKTIMIKINNEFNFEAHDDYYDIRFIFFNAIVDILIKVSNNDDEVKIGKVSQYTYNPLYIFIIIDVLSSLSYYFNIFIYILYCR